MALIKCNECGKEISDKAKMCVNCGNPTQPLDDDYYDIVFKVNEMYDAFDNNDIVDKVNEMYEDYKDRHFVSKRKKYDEIKTYKGVMISKTNPEKDMFKIDLLNKYKDLIKKS